MKLAKGIYLIIDPQQEVEELLHRLKIALESGLSAVQIWDNFSGIDEEQLCRKLADLCQPYDCPLFINNRIELLELGIFQGLHLDELNAKLIHRVSEKYPDLMIGLTVGNQWESILSVESKLAYVSFCSMFPSVTANSCEWVSKEAVKNLAEASHLPFFLAGGISPENLESLNELGYHGIAVVSGVMSAKEPQKAIEKFKKIMQ